MSTLKFQFRAIFLFLIAPLLFSSLFLFGEKKGGNSTSPTHSLLLQQEVKARPTVCLNMIVKDEKSVICRSLTSVLPFIDYWVIVDTGSTDGTQQVIKDFMQSKGIPGELHEQPWVNFGYNRNEALKLAKGKADYVFFIDADEYLQAEPDFQFPELTQDQYFIEIVHAGSRYLRTHLIKNALNWEWKGVLHEAVVCAECKTRATIPHIFNIYTTEGARSKDPKKFEKDAQILEAGLKDEPDNSRYVFYLAQSYRDAGNYPLAIQNYKKRIEMGGWEEEIFISMFQVASLEEAMEMPDEVVIADYKKAYAYRKSRIEPLFSLARRFNREKKSSLAYEIAKLALSIPRTRDILFVQNWMYEYGLSLELSVAAYWTGKYEECQKISLELLEQKNLPPSVRKCVEKNLEFANGKLLEQMLGCH